MTSPTTIHNRADAVAFLDRRIGSGVKPGLDRITGLLELLGNPHQAYPTIHVAGTNGKTTVTRMVQQILGAHGLATGGFTSPHLSTVEERFVLHGAVIDGDTFVDAVRDVAWFVSAYEQEHDTTITYFELTVAIAYSLFATAAVDVAAVEVGLGGRLDATNVVEAAVSVVTGIDIDHTEYLGTTVEEIAPEKAAILKSGGTLVSGRLGPEAEGAVSHRVDEVGGNWIRYGRDFTVDEALVAVGGWQASITGVHGEYADLFLPIHGRHQVDNLATAIAACEMFIGRALDDDALRVAVGSLTAPGRLEVVRRRPLVLVDGAHNPQGFRGLAQTLDAEFPPLPWKLVLGVRGERPIEQLVVPLRGAVDAVYAAAADDSMAIDPAIVAQKAGDALDVAGAAFESPSLALAAALDDAGPEGGVIIAGSLYLVGDLREIYATGADRSAEAHRRYEAEIPDEPEFDLDDDDASDDFESDTGF